MVDLTGIIGHGLKISLGAPFVSWIKRLNRLTITGQEHVPGTTNTLFVANHRSFLDPFLVAFAARGYGTIWKYWLSPYTPIAADVVTTPFRKFMIYRLLRCIPVNRGRFSSETHQLMSECLQQSTMLLFPEGGITPTGRIKPKGRPGVGALIHRTRCTVVPIYHHGLEQILPVWASRFYWGKDIYCRIGAPLDFTEELTMPDERETWERIVAKLIDGLRALEEQFVQDTQRSLDLPAPPAPPQA